MHGEIYFEGRIFGKKVACTECGTNLSSSFFLQVFHESLKTPHLWTIRINKLDYRVPIAELLDLFVFYVPSAATTAILCYKVPFTTLSKVAVSWTFAFVQIITSLQTKKQSDANVRKNKRITITFVLICVSWAVMTLPYRLFKISTSFGVLRSGGSHAETIQRHLNLGFGEGVVKLIYMAYSSVNCIFLLVLLKNFRQPFRRCFASRAAADDAKDTIQHG